MTQWVEKLLTLADVAIAPHFAVRPVERALALVAVDALGVVLAVLADAAALVVTVDVQREALLVDLLRVDALVRVAVAVAGCGEISVDKLRLILMFVNRKKYDVL